MSDDSTCLQHVSRNIKSTGSVISWPPKACFRHIHENRSGGLEIIRETANTHTHIFIYMYISKKSKAIGEVRANFCI
jgi:hypothetical protein